MRLVFLGPPGVGKGTHATIIADEMGVSYYSTGDIFRDILKEKSSLSEELEEYVNVGDLVPDEIVFEIVREILSREVNERGWVLDGYPRNKNQAELLDDFLRDRGEKLDYAVYLYADPEVLVNRLTNRRVCPHCKAIYNLINSPPEREGVCDVCGEKLIQREDDQIDVIKKRIDIFEKEVGSLKEYYESTGALLPISGEGELKEVANRIENELKKEEGRE